MRAGGRWVVIVILLVSHFGLHPLWSGWLAGPDLLAGGLLLGSLLLRAGHAAALGFVLGLLEASMALGPLGPTMLTLAVAGFTGAWLRDVFYSDTGRFIPWFLVFGVWVIQGSLTVATGGSITVQSLLVYAPISAVITALVCWTVEWLVSVFVS